MAAGHGQLTAILAGAADWVCWVAIGDCLLALVPVLRALRSRNPFTSGNAWSFAVAGAVAVCGWAAFGLPVWAAKRAIVAEDSGLPAEWFLADFSFEWWPLWLAAALALIAGTVATGARVASETEGLV